MEVFDSEARGAVVEIWESTEGSLVVASEGGMEVSGWVEEARDRGLCGEDILGTAPVTRRMKR